jgi:hypothetical protein
MEENEAIYTLKCGHLILCGLCTENPGFLAQDNIHKCPGCRYEGTVWIRVRRYPPRNVDPVLPLMINTSEELSTFKYNMRLRMPWDKGGFPKFI